MKNLTKKMFSIFMILTVFVTLFSTKVDAKEYGDYGDEDIFCTYETVEFQRNNELSGLEYQINDDGVTVTVIGSYILDAQGNVDETTCDKNVIIPEKVTYNGVTYTVTKTRETFLQKPVETVSFPDTIIEIGFDTLSGTYIKELEITKNVKIIDPDGIKYNPYLKKLWVNKYNNNFSSTGNIIYSKDNKTLILTANLEKQKVNVKNGVETIKRNAFLNCVFEMAKSRFFGNISYVVLPSSIKLLEDGSIPYDIDIIQFTSTKIPTIETNLICTDDESNKPILLVPKNLVSQYKKISYNGYKVKNSQVIYTLKSTAAQKNRVSNDKVLKYFDDTESKKKPSQITQKQYEKIRSDYLPLIKDAKNDIEKINIICNAVSNRIYITDSFSGNVWDIHNKPEKGATKSWAINYTVVVLKAVGLNPIKIFYLDSNIKNSVPNTYVIGVHSGNELLLVDILSILGTSYNTKYTPLNQYTGIVGIDRTIFDLYNKLSTIDYVTF